MLTTLGRVACSLPARVSYMEAVVASVVQYGCVLYSSYIELGNLLPRSEIAYGVNAKLSFVKLANGPGLLKIILIIGKRMAINSLIQYSCNI